MITSENPLEIKKTLELNTFLYVSMCIKINIYLCYKCLTQYVCKTETISLLTIIRQSCNWQYVFSFQHTAENAVIPTVNFPKENNQSESQVCKIRYQNYLLPKSNIDVIIK